MTAGGFFVFAAVGYVAVVAVLFGLLVLIDRIDIIRINRRAARDLRNEMAGLDIQYGNEARDKVRTR